MTRVRRSDVTYAQFNVNIRLSLTPQGGDAIESSTVGRRIRSLNDVINPAPAEWRRHGITASSASGAALNLNI
jgi:hypothetical protein